MLKYKIFLEKNLLVEVLTNIITLSKLNKLHDECRGDSNMIKVNKVLTNVLEATFDLTFNEMLDYIEILKKDELPPNFKWAILTNDAYPTMFSMLLKEDAHFKNNVEVFCTLKASLKYLDIDFKENEFNANDYVIIN